MGLNHVSPRNYTTRLLKREDEIKSEIFFLRRRENQSTQKKTSGNRVGNLSQQIQATCGTQSSNQTQVTLVGGKFSLTTVQDIHVHVITSPAPKFMIYNHGQKLLGRLRASVHFAPDSIFLTIG